MTKKLEPDEVELLKAICQKHPVLSEVYSVDESPLALDRDPWKSNFRAVSVVDDQKLCRSVADVLGVEFGVPRAVALMRSVSDPIGKIFPFHDIHIDSRASRKVLVVLVGEGVNPLFAHCTEASLSIRQKLELLARTTALKLMQLTGVTRGRNYVSHSLSSTLASSATDGGYICDEPGTVITFNNLRPHHSHPLPTNPTLLLQVVYS